MAAIGRPHGGGRDWRVAAVLSTAFATVFLFSAYDRGQFYRAGSHDILTRNHLTIATNLSFEHGLVQFKRRHVGPDGAPTYLAYHRFPLLGYGLIKLATMPFGADLSARLFAARMLMLAFFSGAAVLGYLSLYRLTGRRAIALSAVLLGFSSYPLLFYADMVATEGVMDLFAVMLAFHGVAVYSQRHFGGGGAASVAAGGAWESGFGQLCAKFCAAVFIGWHVYGLLLVLLLAALPLAIWARDWRGLRHGVMLGAVTVLVGLCMLAFNLLREYGSYGGSRPFVELPSLISAWKRTGLASREFGGWAWLLQDQFRRIGEAALPWALAKALRGVVGGHWHWVGGACLGLASAAICRPGARHRIAWSALALCGMGWALPMRHNMAEHGFEALFHVGAPLAASALTLARLRRFHGLAPAATVVAAFGLFAASSWLMGQVGRDAQAMWRERTLLADAQAIRQYTLQDGVPHKVFQPGTLLARHQCCRQFLFYGIDFALAPKPHADFVVATDLLHNVPWRSPLSSSPARRSLTPGNRLIFLYEPDAFVAELAALRGVYEDHVHASRPAHDGVRFKVHRFGDAALLYVGEGEHCPTNSRARFFLHAYPVDVADLPVRPASRGRARFANLDFRGQREFWTRRGKCYALRFLPNVPMISVHTGEFRDSGGRRHHLWQARIALRAGASSDGEAGDGVLREYQRIEAGIRLARSVWDVYLLNDDGHVQLAYLKAQCAAGDTTERFFLHVMPVNAQDLPKARRRLGFDNWDFHFLDRDGRLANGKCVVRASLPKYGVTAVRTGQYDQAAGPLWMAEFQVPPDPQE